MKNNKGFTMLETLSAFSLLLVITLTIFPTLVQVRSFQHDLAIERQVVSYLHEEFFFYLQTSNTDPYTKTNIKIVPVTLTFHKENDWIKGCARWTNYREFTEEFCLYAPKE